LKQRFPVSEYFMATQRMNIRLTVATQWC